MCAAAPQIMTGALGFLHTRKKLRAMALSVPALHHGHDTSCALRRLAVVSPGLQSQPVAACAAVRCCGGAKPAITRRVDNFGAELYGLRISNRPVYGIYGDFPPLVLSLILQDSSAARPHQPLGVRCNL
ncbi:Hypothetical predicted protein [Scomber scombrus]|uniref:Uncharacterized protein n=1 Tax=Scomber scombrus TaxID=13677 RepID=A0AAV1P866_SCOSC